LNTLIYSTTTKIVKDTLITIKENGKKNSPQDGCQMVEVNLIPAKLFHITITTDLHYNMHTFTIFVLILNTLDFGVH
jgi:hypothetical protein